jgi:small subunit ribosomal protein S10
MPKKDSDLQKDKLRIKIKAYDPKLIDNSVRQIIETIKRQGGEIIGPIPLPTEFKKYTVNRSTFVHKKSREQFELRIHKRLLDIMNPEQKTIESLTDLNLPSGVDVEIKME